MKVVSEWRSSYAPKDLSRTLIVISCSGAKTNQLGLCDPRLRGESISQSLPRPLWRELASARETIARRIIIDDHQKIPALQRYNGSFYQIALTSLIKLMNEGAHVLILSAAYGVVTAAEPIGIYNQTLKLSWWPNQILERILLAYASQHWIRSVRGFCSATGPYRTILGRVVWEKASIEDVLLFTPPVSAGNLVKSPREQGHALAAWGLTIGT